MTDRAQVLNVLEQKLRALLGPDAGIDPSRTLEDYGIDSLERLDLLMEVEEALNIRLKAPDISGDIPLKDVARLILEKAETPTGRTT